MGIGIPVDQNAGWPERFVADRGSRSPAAADALQACGFHQLSIYTSIWDSGTLREKVTLQLRLRAGESQLECNVWRLCERCFLFQGRPPTSNAFIGDALDTVLDRLDCKFV